MLWAIAHAQLTVVVLVILLGAAGLFLLSPYSRTENLVQPESASVLTSITERLLHTFFPGMSMIIAMTVITLLVLLPPSALFSFLIARRTTRRLEGLVDAARALREGRYDTRVEVVGEDEVAQLQSDFNAMADDLAEVQELLLNERFSELYMEGQRQIDLVRFGLIPDLMANGDFLGTSPTRVVKFPLTRSEAIDNPNIQDAASARCLPTVTTN